MDAEVEVTTEVGPNEVAAGVIYIEDVELEGTQLRPGLPVTVRDGAGRRHSAVVDERVGDRWGLLLATGDQEPSILLALRVARRLEADGDHGASEAEAIRTIVRRYQLLAADSLGDGLA